MQNDFCHADGAAGRRGARVADVQATVPAQEAMLAAARRAGVRVVHVRTEHWEWTDAPSWTARLGGGPPYCLPGSWGAAFFGPLQPAPGELVVTKHRYSAFVGTDLELALRARGVQTLVVTGTNTNVCVDSTARDAYMRDFYVVVPPECCASGDGPENHEAGLRLLARAFAAIVPAADVRRCWEVVQQG